MAYPIITHLLQSNNLLLCSLWLRFRLCLWFQRSLNFWLVCSRQSHLQQCNGRHNIGNKSTFWHLGGLLRLRSLERCAFVKRDEQRCLPSAYSDPESMWVRMNLSCFPELHWKTFLCIAVSKGFLLFFFMCRISQFRNFKREPNAWANSTETSGRYISHHWSRDVCPASGAAFPLAFGWAWLKSSIKGSKTLQNYFCSSAFAALVFGPAFGSGFLGSSSNQKLTLRRSNMCSLHSLHSNRSKL